MIPIFDYSSARIESRVPQPAELLVLHPSVNIIQYDIDVVQFQGCKKHPRFLRVCLMQNFSGPQTELVSLVFVDAKKRDLAVYHCS